MKKLFLIYVVINLLNTAYASAATLNIDPSTPEGRSQAYAALAEGNAKSNGARFLKSLNALQKSSDKAVAKDAEALAPQVEKLINSLK